MSSIDKMPERPRSHTLEDESRRAFAALLPSEWVIRSLPSDYGIDEQVEVFDREGQATGLMFLAQVKATDRSDLNAALKLSFRLATYRYYDSLELPVMILRYHSPSKEVYWRWFHEFKERPQPGRKTLTMHIPASSEWNEVTPDEITASLRVFRQLKSPSCPHPILFSLLLSDSEVAGTPSPLLRIAIQDAARALRGIVQISENVPIGAHPRIAISKDTLSVDLAGLKSFTLRFKERYSKAAVITKLPHDVLTAVAFVLAKAGHFNDASEIASSHLDQGTLLGSADVFFELLGAMARSRRVPDALRLAKMLLQSADAARLGQWLLIVTRARTSSLHESELKYLREVMQMFIEKASELGDMRLLATSHYNLANHLRGQGGPDLKSAFTHYRLATKSEPGYRQRAYFWKELGGVLHLLGHFAWAAEAYQRAIQLGGERKCLALRADSLMFAGRYRDAFEQFEEYIRVETNPDDEWHLKNFMLSHLVNDLGIEKQKRDPARANKLADVSTVGDEEGLIRLREAIRFDAFSSFVWFNLGAVLSGAGVVQDAFEAYLFAGVCSPHDTEAWSRALLYGLMLSSKNSLNAPLAICIARMAYRQNGQRFLERLRKHVEQQPPSFPAAKCIELVADAVQDIDRMNRLTDVRIVGQGASYNAVLGPDKL